MADQAVDTGDPDRVEPAGSGRRAVPAAPAVPNGFAGRSRELAALRAEIERAGLDTLAGRPVAPRSRVLLIAGRPGSGRSALAAELARQLVAEGGYPDGVLQARLTDPGGEPVSTERTARALLGPLGITAVPGSDLDDLSEALRAALGSRRAVLLLDDVATPEQLLDLVPDTRGCLVVATAEGPLTGVPDVRPCTLGGLDCAAAIELLARGAGETRIAVDPRAAESLAEECGTQPAALVLMAGWLAARPETSVADALRRLRAIRCGSAPMRCGSGCTCGQPGCGSGCDCGPSGCDMAPVARVFHLVHGSLSAPAVRILRLTCLAPAGYVDAQIVSALAGCSVTAARTVLADFAALGLLRVVSAPAGALPGTGRPRAAGPGHETAARSASADHRAQYAVPGCLDPLLRAVLHAHERPSGVQLARARMLERTVRQLQSCWASAEPEGSAARKRLAGLPRGLRFGTPAAAAEWLHTRLPGLLAAARLSVAEGELDTLARRLISALARALDGHCEPQDAAPELYRLHELVLDVAERRGRHRERAVALLNLGDLDSGTGRLRQALDRYRAALEAARQGGDGSAAVRALECLGGTYDELGDWLRAADWYGRALVRRQTEDDLAGAARLHGRIGAALTYAGQWDAALREWRAAAAAYRRLGDLPSHARVLVEVARVQEYAGQPQEALRTCDRALERARQAGDRQLEAALRLGMADVFERVGDPVAARAHRAAAERELREVPARRDGPLRPNGPTHPPARPGKAPA